MVVPSFAKSSRCCWSVEVQEGVAGAVVGQSQRKAITRSVEPPEKGPDTASFGYLGFGQ